MIGTSANRMILVADTDDIFAEKLAREAEKQPIKMLRVRHGNEAQAVLADKNNRFAGVFINPDICHPSGIAVVRASYFHRPNTPVYFIVDDFTILPVKESDLNKIGVLQTIKKPISYAEMQRIVSPVLSSFDMEVTVNMQKLTTPNEEEELLSNEEGFIAIRADDFISGNKSFFDVYVKIASKKFVKLLFAGDIFPPERLQSYLNKGVKYFYIRKDLHENYLAYCDHLSSALIKRSDLSIDFRASQLMNAGEETTKFLKEAGLNQDNIQYATKFVENIRQFIQQLKLERFEAFKAFMNNIQSYEHGVGTVILAAILANKLEIQMEKPTQTIGIAAMFHDIALNKMSPELWDEDESKMTEAQKIVFYQHPVKGAELMKAVNGIDPVAIQAIEQHHMRTGKKGFPHFHLNQRSRVGEIIGVCDEFNLLIKKNKQQPLLNFKGVVEDSILPHFSRQIAYAFRSAFFPNMNH